MFEQTRVKTATILAVIVGLAIYTLVSGYFARELVVEAAILAILAMSLDMIAGYGGMVSLCHGAIFGIGAYTFAVVNVLLGGAPILALLAAILVASAFGAAVGAVTSRTRGIFFIMATLAFGQMVYVLVFDSKWLGGDDGLWGLARLDLSAIGVDLQDSFQFAAFCLVGLALMCPRLATYSPRSPFRKTSSWRRD